MIKYVEGDLILSDAQALVNTVNTVGVMGKGIALQFKEKFPYNFEVYYSACKKAEMTPGKMLVVNDSTLLERKIIINFPTKKDWKHPSKYEYIEEGLKDLVQIIKAYNIRSIAIPPLGCGNGGLEWSRVKILMENYLNVFDDDDVEISIFEPNEAIKEILKKQDSNKEVNLTPVRALLLYAMYYYDSLGEDTSLFVANKIAYLMQRLGEPSFKQLHFAARHYGPYCVGVEHLVHALNGKYLKGLEQMTLTPFEPIELNYDKITEVSQYVKKELKYEQTERLKRLLSLITDFQSALSLEILTSVDFIKKENPGISKEETWERIQEWSNRKKSLFKDKYVFLAYEHLEQYANNCELFFDNNYKFMI
jgi:O-acetyl-ADP-ribose deacetylase (regulator of RNase III)